eukprot:scaffold49837_cov48-Phaeocystis_antarctica.AAC.1
MYQDLRSSVHRRSARAATARTATPRALSTTAPTSVATRVESSPSYRLLSLPTCVRRAIERVARRHLAGPYGLGPHIYCGRA